MERQYDMFDSQLNEMQVLEKRVDSLTDLVNRSNRALFAIVNKIERSSSETHHSVSQMKELIEILKGETHVQSV